MSNIIPMPQEYDLRIDRQTIDLLLWAKRNPEAARALVEGKAEARLMLAAPALLASLVEVEVIFRHFRPVNLIEELPSYYADIIAKINDATGKKKA